MTEPRILADRLVEKTFGKTEVPAGAQRQKPKSIRSVADRIKEAKEARNRSRTKTKKVRSL